MSREPSDHENLNPDEPLDDFEAALAALRPHVDRSQSRTEFIPFDVPGNTATLQCANPLGHEFVCLHCGADAPRTGRARRWAWPAALVAMTSVAAAMLMMLVVDRSAQVAEREQKLAVANAAPIATAAKPIEKPDRLDAGSDLRNARRRLALHEGGRPRILSAADTELSDDLLASHAAFTSGAAVSFTDTENGDARERHRALMRRLLREYGAAAGPAE